MSDHADTIRRNLYGTLPSQDPLVPDQREALHALDALLVERDDAVAAIQRLRDALEQIAHANFAAIYGPPIPRLQEIAKAALAAVRVEDER